MRESESHKFEWLPDHRKYEQRTQRTMVLSRTVAPGKKSVNMVDWEYSSFPR